MARTQCQVATSAGARRAGLPGRQRKPAISVGTNRGPSRAEESPRRANVEAMLARIPDSSRLGFQERMMIGIDLSGMA
jgi:hypothetical protein